MTDLRKMAQELLTLGAVRDAVQTEYGRRHAALEAEYAEVGVEKQRVLLPDGTDFGTVVVVAGAISVEILDHTAMIEWLEAEHPTELIVKKVYDINPAYWKVLVGAAKKAGVGIDPATGQRLDWMRVTVGDKTIRATATSNAKEMIRTLMDQTGIRMELET